MPPSVLTETRAVATDVEPPLTWGRWLLYWAVVVAWMGVISYLSTDAFSAQNTNRYMDPFLRFLFPYISTQGLLLLHAVVRKAAHFSEFFVLGVLAYWAFRGGRPPLWSPMWTLKALILAGGYAALDEIHQNFVPSRTPSPWDSGIDFFGAAVGQLAIYLYSLYSTMRARRAPR